MRAPHHLHHPVGFMVQPTNHSPLGFEGPNQEIIMVILWAKLPTVTAGYEAKTKKTE
jgi:hypothetical protein